MKCKLLILSFLSVFFVAQSQTGNSNYKEIGAPMPAIRLVVPPLTVNESTAKKGKKVATPQNQIVTEKELKNDANLLVMMFNPTCGHCEEQTDLFLQNISLFKKSKLVLMAGAQMIPYLEHFNRGRQIDKFPQTIIMGVDSSQFIEKTYLYEILPQINVYDAERKLIRSFTGIVPIDSIRSYIQ